MDKRDRRLSRVARVLLALERHADRPWFLPAVSAFPLTDYALPFLPNQMLLVGLAVALPHRWVALAASFVLATALGAILVALAIQYWGVPLIDQALGGELAASAKQTSLDAIRRYGVIALAGFAMLPWPPRAAVIVCAIAGLPPLLIGLAVATGRTFPALAFTAVGAQAPHLLRRVSAVDRILQEVDAARR